MPSENRLSVYPPAPVLPLLQTINLAYICYIEAKANSAIPQRLAALFYTLCNDFSHPEIHKNLPDLVSVLHTAGLPENLTPVRRQVLAEMFEKIKKVAHFFNNKQMFITFVTIDLLDVGNQRRAKGSDRT